MSQRRRATARDAARCRACPRPALSRTGSVKPLPRLPQLLAPEASPAPADGDGSLRQPDPPKGVGLGVSGAAVSGLDEVELAQNDESEAAA